MDAVASSVFRVSKRYLIVPVRKGAGESLVQLKEAGRLVRYFKVEPGTPENCDYLAFYNVEALLGRTLEVEASGASPALFQSEKPEGLEGLYKEAGRPQFHFTSRRGWLNDPNGLVYYGGVWHLFYQHAPFSAGWSTMHWGHAVSSDLLHWKELEVEIFPDEHGAAFSGSALVDWANDSGLKDGSQPPLLAFYTAAGDQAPVKTSYTQRMLYSSDGGASWKQFQGNPVLKELAPGNRDPKIVRHAPSGKWIMALYMDSPRKDFGRFGLFSSRDLKSWTLAQEIEMPGTECPDFFEAKIEGSSESRWVLFNASSAYLAGSFDGANFVPEQEPKRAYEGRGAYAPQTYSDAPDGWIVQFAWFQGDFPGMPFSQAMSLPLELSLRKTSDGLILIKRPARELDVLRSNGAPGRHLRLTASIDAGKAAGAAVNGVELLWSPAEGLLRFGGLSMKPHLDGGKLKLDLFVDGSLLELFANDGEHYAPLRANPEGGSALPAPLPGVSAIAFETFSMASVWP